MKFGLHLAQISPSLFHFFMVSQNSLSGLQDFGTTGTSICTNKKDFGLQNKNWVPFPSKIGLSVVFKVGRWGLIED